MKQELQDALQQLRQQSRGHWIDDTQDYGWDDDSLPWSTSEG